jgi:uncharacterized protein
MNYRTRAALTSAIGSLIRKDAAGADPYGGDVALEGKSHLTVPFEIKASDDDTEGAFEGMASTFGNTDMQNDIMVQGAFEGAKPAKVKMLWGHDPHEVPIGKWTSFEETEKGLFVKGQLLMDNQKPREIYNALKAKALDAMSIGFMVAKDGAEFDPKKRMRRITKVDLWEISVVTFPANPKARVAGVKSIDALQTERDFELFLRDAGFSRAEAKVLCANGFKHLLDQRDAGDEGDPVTARILSSLSANINHLQ